MLDFPRFRRRHVPSARARRAMLAPRRALRFSRSRCGFAMILDGVGSGSSAVWRPSRIIAFMRYRTARGSVGLYTSLPSPVCVLSSFSDLTCVLMQLAASFSCQLVHALPYCPKTAYAVPLPEPPDNAPAYNASNLPDTLAAPLLAYLSNFTTSLLTLACGRDHYSPLKTCADCQEAYRHWLCAISLPRCGEFPSTTQPQQLQEQQHLLQQPALLPQPSGTTPRNAALGNSTGYTALLPCIETCNAADRACPIFLGFRCPSGESTTAQASYGVGFVDNAVGDVRGGGVPGAAQDRWGNVYCNGD